MFSVHTCRGRAGWLPTPACDSSPRSGWGCRWRWRAWSARAPGAAGDGAGGEAAWGMATSSWPARRPIARAAVPRPRTGRPPLQTCAPALLLRLLHATPQSLVTDSWTERPLHHHHESTLSPSTWFLHFQSNCAIFWFVGVVY